MSGGSGGKRGLRVRTCGVSELSRGSFEKDTVEMTGKSCVAATGRPELVATVSLAVNSHEVSGKDTFTPTI